MSKNISYSVAIRTLCTSGEKYNKLIDSIIKQSVQPEKIVVVVPDGYDFPKSITGTEVFVRSKKGMLYQRAEALEYIDSELTFFSDDDIEFEDGFIEKLSEPIVNNDYGCTAGPLLDFFPPNNFKYALSSVLGGSCIMLKGRKNNYVRILRTGGWSYNYSIDQSSHKIYDTESFAGTCFMAKTKYAKEIDFLEESWCEQLGYAAFEDRIFAYKMIVNGYKCCIVSDAEYIHNDGKTSIKDLRLEPIYAAAYNHYVFWYRYIYSLQQNVFSRFWSQICINYYEFMSKVYGASKVIKSKDNIETFRTVRKAFKDAKRFVKSEDYKKLKGVYANKG